MSHQITVQQLSARLENGEPTYLVDVRQQWEHDLAALAGAVLLPLDQLPARLGEIAVPTLVVHGAEDQLQSPKNAEMLASSIRGAELMLWPEAGHLYVTDEPEADVGVARFLDRHSSP